MTGPTSSAEERQVDEFGPGSSRAGYRANLAALTRAQKPSRDTAAYSRLVNRPLGRRVAAASHQLGMSPNQATVVSATMSGTALLILALVEPSAMQAVAVAVLLAGGYVMDSVDGQLARLRGGGSLSGEWLDHTVDCFKTSLLHLAVLVSWYRWPPVGEDAVLLIPLGFEVVQVVTYFGLIMMPLLRAKGGSGAASPLPSSAERPEHPLRKWLILPTDYGALCWVFLLGVRPAALVWGYGLLAAVNAAALVWGLRKWWRELRDLDTRTRAT
jgi:phosphatidylglycerophosphate synthase